MSDTISRQNLLRALTDISYNHCKTSGEQEIVDTVKTLVATMANVHDQGRDADCITRRDAMHVLDNCRFASEQEKKYAYSLMEQVASAEVKDTNDMISRQAAIDVLGVFTQADALGHTPKQIVEALPSAQPERKMGADNECTFLTCKHGGFGDDACSKCRWAYRDMYEANEEGAQDESDNQTD